MITVSSLFDIEQLEVLSMEGRVLLVQKTTAQKLSSTLDISGLQQGLYLIRATGNNLSACTKILKIENE
jgi:hypothetical protein